MRYLLILGVIAVLVSCGDVTSSENNSPNVPQMVQYVTCRVVETKDSGPSQDEYGNQVYVIFSTSGHILSTDYYTWSNADPGETICGYWTAG